jgi:hypothetical protein
VLPSKIEEVLGPHLPADKTTWKLLYRGTRDGFGASDFHSKCDHQGATVTVVKSTNGYVFGGVTGVSWTSADRFVPTTEAFMFGIRTHGSPYAAAAIFMATQRTDAAMYAASQFGPVFGGYYDAHNGGASLNTIHDLFIASNSHNNSESSSVTGTTYTWDDARSGPACSYFTGDAHFQVEEIEVFAIVQPPPWAQSLVLTGDDSTRAIGFLPVKIEEVLGPRFPAANPSWKLLFRGTRDGFGATDFHSRCDHQGATVTVVKSTSGHVFGGVTVQPWGSETGRALGTRVFLFGIRTHGSPDAAVILKAFRNTDAIVNGSPLVGPTFGGDLRIASNAHTSSNSSSELGFSFTTNGTTYGTSAARRYFAGSRNFQVAEIEVFTIVPSSPWDSSLILTGDDSTRATGFLPAKIAEVVGPQFPPATTTWQLLYRGTRDGFDSADFHRKCDHQGATVTVVKSTKGFVFGGVTGVPWTSAGGAVATTKAFLFGIRTNGSRDAPDILLPTHNMSEAMFDSLDYGPSFGGKRDLAIANNAHVSTDSQSDLGFTYTLKGIAKGTSTARQYFAGSRHFQLEEIEVFTVVPMSPWDSSLALTGDDSTRATGFLPAKIAEVVGPRFAPATTAWRLLYRGTRDGFRASDFHSKCDHQGATITVVKSANGYVFGGVTGVAWTSSGGHVAASTSFLYGIRTDGSPDAAVIFKATQNTNGVMYDASDAGPSFGARIDLIDLYVANHADRNLDSRSNLQTYGGNGVTAQNSVTYFAASYVFRVAEIEVFQIVAPPSHPVWGASLILTGDDSTRATAFLPAKIAEVAGPQFPPATTTWRLLYRGTRDGFGAADFHRKCDHQGATVTVVKSAKGYVFGGVAEVSWTSVGEYVNTRKAFVYGIRTHGSPDAAVIFNLTGDSRHAMAVGVQLGPSFGVGPDLYIPTNSNVRRTCRAEVGSTYTGNGVTSNNTAAGKLYFAGFADFGLVEMEVFQLVAPIWSPPPTLPPPPLLPPPPPPSHPVWGASLILTGDDSTRATAFLPSKIAEVVGPQFPPATTTWWLLYRGTRDGFGASDFHSKCDHKGATVTVVKSTSGYVFGGVAGVPWTSLGDYVDTRKAFVYGIRTHGSPDAAVDFLPNYNTIVALYDASDFGPTFGGKTDLRIASNALNKTSSSSNLGYTYTRTGITFNTSASQKFLAGTRHFQVAEIEVFTLVPPPPPPPRLPLVQPPSPTSLPRWDSSLILTGDDSTRATAFLPAKIAEVVGPQFPPATTTWRLLYRGTRDGFGAADFHRKCDHQGATVTVVKSANGYVFGGVAGVPWTSGGGAVGTNTVFLFGIRTYGNPDTPDIFKSYQSTDAAMWDASTSGPSFGKGPDLHIGGPGIASPSHSRLGVTFNGANSTTFSTVFGEHYFTGGFYFEVAEVEIFKLVQPTRPVRPCDARGANHSYSNWASNASAGDCARISGAQNGDSGIGGTWLATPCGVQLGFICEVALTVDGPATAAPSTIGATSAPGDASGNITPAIGAWSTSTSATPTWLTDTDDGGNGQASGGNGSFGRAEEMTVTVAATTAANSDRRSGRSFVGGMVVGIVCALCVSAAVAAVIIWRQAHKSKLPATASLLGVVANAAFEQAAGHNQTVSCSGSGSNICVGGDSRGSPGDKFSVGSASADSSGAVSNNAPHTSRFGGRADCDGSSGGLTRDSLATHAPAVVIQPEHSNCQGQPEGGHYEVIDDLPRAMTSEYAIPMGRRLPNEPPRMGAGGYVFDASLNSSDGTNSSSGVGGVPVYATPTEIEKPRLDANMYVYNNALSLSNSSGGSSSGRCRLACANPSREDLHCLDPNFTSSTSSPDDCDLHGAYC